MKKFISQNKMSKKTRKELDSKNRVVWENINPVTKKIENKKAYNRKKAQKGYEYFLDGPFYIFKTG